MLDSSIAVLPTDWDVVLEAETKPANAFPRSLIYFPPCRSVLQQRRCWSSRRPMRVLVFSKSSPRVSRNVTHITSRKVWGATLSCTSSPVPPPTPSDERHTQHITGSAPLTSRKSMERTALAHIVPCHHRRARDGPTPRVLRNGNPSAHTETANHVVSLTFRNSYRVT